MTELVITEEGKREIEERLRFLKNEKRPEVLDSFDDDVNERAKTNVSKSFDKILALENLVIAFRHAEVKAF